MSDLDAVLERLVTDAAFAQELSRNPTTALAGYELSGEDLSTLSTQVSFDRGAGALVEERISKSSMFGLLSTMAGGLSGLGGDAAGLGGPDTTPAGVGVENPTTIGNPNEAPGGAQGAVDTFTPAPAEEGPEESVAIHEVDEQPAPDVGFHEVDQPAAVAGLVNPGERIGFNPQPDPPGLPG